MCFYGDRYSLRLNPSLSHSLIIDGTVQIGGRSGSKGRTVYLFESISLSKPAIFDPLIFSIFQDF